jgi:hypothetical protein
VGCGEVCVGQIGSVLEHDVMVEDEEKLSGVV